MKKIVSICMLVITILSYLVVITINQSADYEQLMRMGETQNSFKIYVQGSHSAPSDEVEFFNYLVTFLLFSQLLGKTTRSINLLHTIVKASLLARFA